MEFYNIFTGKAFRSFHVDCQNFIDDVLLPGFDEMAIVDKMRGKSPFVRSSYRFGCCAVSCEQKAASLSYRHREPEILTIPIPPGPNGVDMAAIVLLIIDHLIKTQVYQAVTLLPRCFSADSRPVFWEKSSVFDSSPRRGSGSLHRFHLSGECERFDGRARSFARWLPVF